MENTKTKKTKGNYKLNKDGSNRRLVVKNRKKLIIIILVVVALATGLGVGLYFAFRTNVNYPTELEQKSENDVQSMLTETFNDNQHEAWGLYIGSSDCPFCNAALHGDGDDTESLEGEFTSYLRDNTRNDLPWYRFSNDGIEEQKTKINNAIGYALLDGQEYIQSIDFPTFGNIPTDTSQSELKNDMDFKLLDERGTMEMNTLSRIRKDDNTYEDDFGGLEWGTPTFVIFAEGRVISYVNGFKDPDADENNGDGMDKDWFLTWEDLVWDYLSE